MKSLASEQQLVFYEQLFQSKNTLRGLKKREKPFFYYLMFHVRANYRTPGYSEWSYLVIFFLMVWQMLQFDYVAFEILASISGCMVIFFWNIYNSFRLKIFVLFFTKITSGFRPTLINKSFKLCRSFILNLLNWFFRKLLVMLCQGTRNFRKLSVSIKWLKNRVNLFNYYFFFFFCFFADGLFFRIAYTPPSLRKHERGNFPMG